jgi:hypothetical protein
MEGRGGAGLGVPRAADAGTGGIWGRFYLSTLDLLVLISTSPLHIYASLKLRADINVQDGVAQIDKRMDQLVEALRRVGVNTP